MRLCCRETHELGATEGKCGDDENIAEAFESIMESPWAMPILAANVSCVLSTTAVDHYAQNSVQGSAWDRDQTRDAYMNPITAVTLIMEKVYSASPYALTPNKLIAMMTTRKIVIAAHPGIGECQ